MDLARLQTSSLKAGHWTPDRRLHWATEIASLVLCFYVVPQEILSSEKPWALVAHDEVNALDLAVDQHVLLDQLALDLVREVFSAAGIHLLLRELQRGGGGRVEQLLPLLCRQLVPLSQPLPVLLLILLANLATL